jgi:outer membrane usher protein
MQTQIPGASTNRSGLLARDEKVRPRTARIAAAIMAIILLTGRSEHAAAADETLLLDVVVNGYSSGKIGEFELHDGVLNARADELKDLGFRVPASVPRGQDGRIALSDLPGLTLRLDQAGQKLYVTAGNSELLPTLLPPFPVTGSGSNIPVESGFGITVNYDIAGTFVGKENIGTGQLDMRVFSPWGVLSSGLLAYAGGGPQGPGTYSTVRLDTTYTYSDPEILRRYRLGDFINGNLSWTRPVRLGGAQIQSDFSMRPDLVTFPLPVIGGSVAVPSTVDVLVNGTQLISRQVQPGPFQIPQLPVITGSSTITMTVLNAFGRQVTTTLPFYASSDMLAPGLQTYSAEFGAVRRNWGFISNDYGPAAGSATYRRGLTDNLTVEAHAEGTSGLAMGGAAVVVNVANLGIINFSAAASTSAGHAGTQFSMGAQRIGRTLSLGTSMTFANRNYRDIAAMNGDPVPRRQIAASSGLSLGPFGSFGVAYIGVDRDAEPNPVPFYTLPGSIFLSGTPGPGGLYYLQPAEHAHVLSASYSLQLGAVSLYVTGYRDFANSKNAGFLIGLTLPLGSRSSVSASGGENSGTSYGQVQTMQSPVSIGDWGYQAYADRGHPSHEFTQLQYKSPWGLVSGGVDQTGRQMTGSAEVQGALSFADGGLFASNTINDSFGVVDTNGLKNVRIMDENRLIGRTDFAGKLLLPDLRSFEVNHISINPNDVPMDANLPFTNRDVRPQDRSGVVVKFPIHTSHGALLRLVDAAGRPLPVGSAAELQATGTSVPVGYDGEAYIEGLSPHNQLTVQLLSGERCVARFAYRPVSGTIPTIGPIPCGQDAP